MYHDRDCIQIVMYNMTHLSCELNDDVQLSILSCKSLIGHVPCSSACANEHIASSAAAQLACPKADVLHVRMQPAVRLTVHCLRAQRRSHQIH